MHQDVLQKVNGQTNCAIDNEILFSAKRKRVIKTWRHGGNLLHITKKKKPIWKRYILYNVQLYGTLRKRSVDVRGSWIEKAEDFSDGGTILWYS
jgi:hypothetical protein